MLPIWETGGGASGLRRKKLAPITAPIAQTKNIPTNPRRIRKRTGEVFGWLSSTGSGREGGECGVTGSTGNSPLVGIGTTAGCCLATSAASRAVKKSMAIVKRPGSVAPRRKIVLPVSERLATGFSRGVKLPLKDPDLFPP